MSSRLFGLIPAAGSGLRAGGSAPKQYSLIGTKTMLRYSTEALLAVPEVDTIFVVLAPDDDRFRRLDWSDCGNRVAPLYCGGATRRDSVLNGLIAASAQVDAEDWVLVHDAARPCLALQEVQRLIETVTRDDTGGILAIRVADTLKRGDIDERIIATEPREALWQAQTPQMFRHGVLLRALRGDVNATDEAAAMEALGEKPRLVEGSQRNLKVTVAADLELAAVILRCRAVDGSS
ncbi:MAG: 2-C-methyl-D-erythritol 4-phosphate cytidylyltransferase [Betaproteobacteria bacterium]|nr:2-C-methyl-D-erythritol 4-phosphate cytidylyltransferase [Betaproteobacteria bacterium]